MEKVANKIKEEPSIAGADGIYIAGAGASAGGLEAFTALVQAIEPGAGVIYILLQHLDPGRESLLPGLLRKWALLPVEEITDGLQPQPDHIYVQPSNKLLRIDKGRLKLEPLPKSGHSGAILIDHFFKSLAKSHKKRAIGIVLSGTASDGSAGLKMIKRQGGITITQDEASAKWFDMPHNAAAGGMVDYKLPPEKIPGKILQLINSGKRQKTEANPETAINTQQIDRILDFLHQAIGKDFSQYKKSTLGRRIERRMSINKIADLNEYYFLLKEKKSEQHVLGKDLLIPVTEFFRDPESFGYICSEILPQVVSRKKEGQPIRIWVAGCSTGQEAYSMAICLTEIYKREGVENVKTQILATDINQASLIKARKGIYTEKELVGLSKERMNTFFIKSDEKYQVTQILRDMCLFAQHNFLTDPPFNNLDLISCRNVLIYMEPVLKKKAMTNFHYGLQEHGLLWLGQSEANTASQKLFKHADKNHRLFKRKDVPAKIHISKSGVQKTDNNLTRDKTENIKKKDFEKIADSIVLENYTPTGVVVNGQMDIVHYRGNTQHYLVQRSGSPSHNLLKLAKTGLAFELRNIINTAKKEVRKIKRTEVPLKVDGHVNTISIEAIPLEEAGGEYVLVLFDKQPKNKVPETEDQRENEGKDLRDHRIAQLERELVQTREHMRTIVENQEVANEELQSANEELMSSSEELQTLNEELETSKEELQSANEEITVANQELRGLNDEVTQERNFAQAIIKTLREPLLILDSELRVQSANRSFYKNFKVAKRETEGRLIYELGNNQWDIPKLRQLLESIIPEKDVVYDYEVTHEFESIGERTMLLNARQVKNEEFDKKLVLLSIDDITERKKNRLELEESIQRYDELVGSSSCMIAVLEGPDMIVRSANEAMIDQLGKGNIIGKPYLKAVPELEEQGLGDLLRKVYTTGEYHHSYEIPVTLKYDDEGKLAYYNFVYQPQRNRQGEVIGVAIIAIEVTPQAELNKKIKETVHKFEEFIYSSPSPIAIFKGKELKIEIANDAQLQTWGKNKNVIGKTLLEAVPELKDQGFDDLLLNVLQTGEPYYASEVPARLERNGKMCTDYYDIVYQPQRSRDGEIEGVAAIANLVTPQAKFHREVMESEEKLRQMANLSPDKITLADALGQAIYCNHSWLEYLNVTEAEFFELSVKELAHPDDYEKAKLAIAARFAQGLDVELEARVRNAAGEYLWHLVRARPIKNRQGEITSWITAATQIHKIKQEEKRKEDFLKMVSHELKTPVTSIKGYAQLLLSMLKEKKAEQLDGIPLVSSLERINNQVSRLTRLISEILDLSRVEDSRLDLNKEIFSMNDLVELNVQDIAYSSKEVQIIIDQKDRFKVNGDRDRLGQVLINFITNAIKYSPDDKNIEVTVYKTADGLGAVSVKDNGIGIADKDQDNIFKRFYRVSGNNEETYSGFGIGLYLSYEMIKRHGGAIKVNSKLGEGSEFIFTLPTID